MPHSAAFIDAKCRRCGAHIGWHGRVTDRPACPRCGDKVPQEDLAADQAEMDSFRQLLRELREANPKWDKWQNARVAAGLTLRQAAKLLEVDPATLSEIEQGKNTPSQFLADRMANCYGGGGYVVEKKSESHR